MEVARLKRFLDSTILFSSIYKDYEKNLKKELFLCHKYLGYTMDDIFSMPVRDRKFYVRQHNKIVEQEKEKWNKKNKK